MFLPHPRVKLSIVGSLRDREVACSASDRQGSNFESCVWRTVSSHSSHHPDEVLLAQFSLYVHKGGPIHFISHIPSHTSSAQKNEEFWSVHALWLAGRVSEFVDDLTRTPDERYSCIVCVNLCAHFLHVQNCERFSTCECRRQKNVRPAPV